MRLQAILLGAFLVLVGQAAAAVGPPGGDNCVDGTAYGMKCVPIDYPYPDPYPYPPGPTPTIITVTTFISIPVTMTSTYAPEPPTPTWIDDCIGCSDGYVKDSTPIPLPKHTARHGAPRET
jgi:hypothetical protein